MLPISLIALVMSASCFGSYIWGIWTLFQRVKHFPIQMKLINALGLFFFAAQILSILRAKFHSMGVTAVGLVLYGVALILFWWAVPYARRSKFAVAFTPVQPTILVCDGPYQYIRHPFYSSSNSGVLR